MLLSLALLPMRMLKLSLDAATVVLTQTLCCCSWLLAALVVQTGFV